MKVVAAKLHTRESRIRCCRHFKPPAYLVHWPHVDDAVPLSRYPEDLIQDLFHVQLLALSKVKPIHNGGALHPQLLQHSTPGGCKKRRDKSHNSPLASRCEKPLSWIHIVWTIENIVCLIWSSTVYVAMWRNTLYASILRHRLATLKATVITMELRCQHGDCSRSTWRLFSGQLN